MEFLKLPSLTTTLTLKTAPMLVDAEASATSDELENCVRFVSELQSPLFYHEKSPALTKRKTPTMV